MAYEQNEFQKKMLNKYPEFSIDKIPKLEKPLTKEERDEAVRKAYENDF